MEKGKYVAAKISNTNLNCTSKTKIRTCIMMRLVSVANEKQYCRTSS